MNQNEKKAQVIIEAKREGYSPEQIGYTMTVGELIDYLQEFDKDSPVYLSHDNGYTYGGISQREIQERWEGEE